MSEQNIHPNKYSELQSIYQDYIYSFNALYQLKTENEEGLNSIYKMIKTKLVDSKKIIPESTIRNILNIIPYNNRYAKSYLSLVKFIFDDYQVKEVSNVIPISYFLFYKEYGIKLDKSDDFEKIKLENLDVHKEDTIYRAIMYNDLERLITFTECDEFNENQTHKSELYPYSKGGYSLLELCCYHGAVDCFKLLRTKFNSKITQTCLKFSFLGGNPEIMSECLKYQTPDYTCMEYAIISHNIDFVTFLMNEYNIKIDLHLCGCYNNLESFLVYFDQTNDINDCLIYSTKFNIPSFCEYFLSLGANINEKNEYEQTALLYAAHNSSKEIVELLISHGANINEKDEYYQTALHYAALNDSKELAEFLITHGININEKDEFGQTALHIAACNRKELFELLISHGVNINEKNDDGQTAFLCAVCNNDKELAAVLISYGININEKDNEGKTALHYAVRNNNKELTELLISHGVNINEKDNEGKNALHIAACNNSKELTELLTSHGAK